MIIQFTRIIQLKVRKNNLPWLNTFILNLMKEGDLSLKLSLKSGRNRHQFISLRNRVVKEMRKSKADLFTTALNGVGGNSKTTWNYIIYKLMQIQLNGKILTESLVIADAVNYIIESVSEISDKFTVKQMRE